MMVNKTIGVMIFMLGVAVGSAVTWRYIKQKYEQISQEEIDSVKKVFSGRENGDAKVRAEMAKEKPDINEYANKLHEQGYMNYSDISQKNKKQEAKPMTTDKPYVITPDEFGESDEYEKISLTYYVDEILTDDNDDLIDDVEDVVGPEALGSFGEYEDDAVFVRNDRLKCDYEILLDQRKYSDVVKKKPHEVW